MFKLVCSRVEEEPVLQELTGVVIPTKPRMCDSICTPACCGRGKNLRWAYCQIRCIALLVLQTSNEILGISVPSIILADLLGNNCLFERVQKVMFCDLWLVDFDRSDFFLCFKVRFVVCDCPVSRYNRLVCLEDFSDLLILVTCKNKAVSTSFPWQKLHSHRDCLRHAQFWFCRPSWARANIVICINEVRECVMKLSCKSCDLDPLPGYVTRNILGTLLPFNTLL